MEKFAIILAAGKGTRMKTDLPKCAFPLLRKPMIEYIIESYESSKVDKIVVVVGHKKEILKDILGDRVEYAFQDTQLGTGHAVMMVDHLLANKEGHTIISLGDMPLIDTQLIDNVFEYHKDCKSDLTVVTTVIDDPTGYGRIIRNDHGNIESIVEEKEANREQRKIREVNTGVYCVNNKKLFEAIKKISNKNNKGEYYLTDIVEIMKEDAVVVAYILKDFKKVMGVNDLYSLSIAENILRLNINKKHMLNGVAMVNPYTITIGQNVTIEENVTIHPNTYITGNSIIKKGAIIGPNTEVHNSVIHEDVYVRHSLVHDSEVKDRTTIGPFAHLRQNTIIGKDNRVGNFVEYKNSTTGSNTKTAHLAYIGDTECGSNVNFGCGSITVNYDGKNKHKTIIEDNSFIGCNTNIIAPVRIGKNSFVAAGSTITNDIPSNSLAIARARQENKIDYIAETKERKGK